MSRKKRDFSREVLPDPKCLDVMVSKTVNVAMRHGKKSTVERGMYSALDAIAKKMNADAMDVFHKALSNLRPVVEVRSRRVGGATYQVPTEVPRPRADSLAIRWLVMATNDRQERSFSERLANEIMDAASNRGIAVKKKEDTHRMAEANKAFAHFRW